ncbi:MAG: SsrA-binding protein, partial [Candidatus Latescibacterota bacterium]
METTIRNKKAHQVFFIIVSVEEGIVVHGTEVKFIRQRKASLA